MTAPEPCLCQGKAKLCGRCRLAELARARLAEKAAQGGGKAPEPSPRLRGEGWVRGGAGY
jgi:hypothetical protein